MTAPQGAVLVLGIALIVFIQWWFFWAGRTAKKAVVTSTGTQEVEVVVHGGYEPSTILVTRGQPVRLVFDRQETSSCSEEVVIGDFGVRKFLPAFQKTIVELTPDHSGRFDFTCGMGMLHGTLVVER